MRPSMIRLLPPSHDPSIQFFVHSLFEFEDKILEPVLTAVF